MGRGNIPPQMVSGVEYALSKNIPVVLVSRCLTGKVFDDYGYKGAGRELTNKGAILGDNLPGHKARLEDMESLEKIIEKIQVFGNTETYIILSSVVKDIKLVNNK